MSTLSIVLKLAFCVFVAQRYIDGCEAAECIKGHLDVIFLFDSSSTVGSGDFNRSLQFASNLAENFQIGPHSLQFGAASFSNSPSNLFNLNTYSEFQSLEKAILGGQYLSGSTSTYLALENAQTLFDQSRGGRTGALKVVVLFTNGRSDDADRTQQQALRLKNSDVFVIVVGLSNSNTQELQAIASNSSSVFSIDNFNSVLKFLQDYSNSACSIQPAECIKNHLDVLFLFDSSFTVDSRDFNNSLRFASNLAENFQIGPKSVQFGAASFSDSPRNLFNLNTFSDFQSIEKAILDAQYISGSTRTYLALENALTLFDQSRGGRTGAPKVVVLFTNGRSDDADRTQQQALRLKNSGVFVIVVGLSNSNTQELQAIASNSSVVFDINNFNGALKFLQDYSNSACSIPPAECIKGHLDVIFLFDSSSTVGSGDFNRSLQFASNLAENFQLGPDKVQFGAASFSDNPGNLFNLNTYSEFHDLEKAILNSQYLSGSTRTYLALENAQTLFDQSRGGRTGAPKVVVLFTNGRSDDADRTQQQALRLKNSGVFVIVVGLSNSDTQELQAVASNSSSVFSVDNFNSALKFLQDYSKTVCSIQPVPCMNGTLDVLYVFDASYTVPVDDFNNGLRFAANLAENFHIGTGGVLFGAISFATSTSRIFDFATFTNYTDLEKAILDIAYENGSANTFLALNDSRYFFGDSRGARLGTPRVAIVFTNGKSSDFVRTAAQATALKQAGVFVISVGYTDANRQELQAISSDPSYVFSIDNFDNLLKALQNYSINACKKSG